MTVTELAPAKLNLTLDVGPAARTGTTRSPPSCRAPLYMTL